MQLSMTVLRSPDKVPPESRTIEAGEFHVGRGPDVDWVLPDPDRRLSKRHFAVAFRRGEWLVADTSTNGTYLNAESDSIGRGAIRSLRDGDRLRLGAYEIGIRLLEDQPATAPPGMEARAPGRDPAGPGPNAGPPAPPASPGAIGIPRRVSPLASLPVSSAILDAGALGEALSADVAPTTHRADLPSPRARQDSAARAVVDAANQAGSPGDAAAMAAFFAGAALSGEHPVDPLATMTGLGQAFRALVSGLRAALIARATSKGEFRIEQTIIRAQGNNPLKFSADDDDALAALVGLGRHTGMTPAAAIEESLRDLRLHEQATLAAMREAVHALLEELSPDRIRAATEQGGGMSVLPAQRKARAWDAYEARHSAVTRALVDGFDSVFGKSFARAYERALGEMASKEQR